MKVRENQCKEIFRQNRYKIGEKADEENKEEKNGGGISKKRCKRADQRQRGESDRNNKENERKRKREKR